MDLHDEIRAVFAVYRATGRTPELPDRELLPKGPAMGPSGWFARLTPSEQARMRHAIELGARQSWAGVWSEQG